MQISVFNRKDEKLCEVDLTKFDGSTLEFLKSLSAKSSYLKKIPFNQWRFTVETAKGRALNLNPKSNLKDLFNKEEIAKKEIKLVFKNLGRQISWQLVFIIEYGGPIAITLLLVIF